MINYMNKIVALFFVLLLTGCIKDGEELCPPEPKVKLHFFAEKFRNASQNPLDDREDIFCDRVTHLRYFLYKDNQLIENKVIDNLKDKSSNCFSLSYDNLAYGNYKMVVVANAVNTLLEGDQSNADNLYIAYPGFSNTEDYFTAVFPFTVNSDEAKEYEVGLLRAHGVIRYTFDNLPSDITGVEVVMTNVHSEKWVTGDYKKACEANHTFIMKSGLRAETDGNFVIGTFPTPANERSAYQMNLYRNGEDAPYFSQVISDTLTVVRNQLLEIATTFNEGNVSFEVVLDSDWDGSLPGGIGEYYE